MSKKKGNSRGVPVDMGDDDLSSALGLEAPIAYGYGAPRASAYGASAFPEEFMLSSRPTSNKGRKQAVAAEAARILEEAKAEEAAQAESDRLYKEYMKLHQPPKSVTCALCKKAETVSEAIAHKWKKHPFGFANQAICAACDAVAVPFTASPKLVWKKEPNMLSARHAKLMKVLDHAGTPSDKLKAQIVASAGLYDPLTPEQRMLSLRGARNQLSAALLTPPEGVMPLTPAETRKLTKSMDKRGGTRRAKSKSKSKSKSRSRSRF